MTASREKFHLNVHTLHWLRAMFQSQEGKAVHPPKPTTHQKHPRLSAKYLPSGTIMNVSI